MGDTLEIFGKEFTNVAGFKAKDDNGNVLTYTRGGGSTPAISVVDTTDSHGGTVREITALEISDTTAIASDVAQGKYFYTAQGVKTAGTASGGSPSATQHSIYFEFSDSTDTTITAYYDSTFISDAITATTPTTYGGKTVTLAQLDGVTWYNPADIPLNTQLIDFTKLLSDTMIDQNGDAIQQQWFYATDYTHIESGMTFAYRASYWGYMAFYDSSKTFISSIYVANDSTQDPDIGTVGVGTLSGSKIPSNATYIRMSVAGNSADGGLLIRTA